MAGEAVSDQRPGAALDAILARLHDLGPDDTPFAPTSWVDEVDTAIAASVTAPVADDPHAEQVNEPLDEGLVFQIDDPFESPEELFEEDDPERRFEVIPGEAIIESTTAEDRPELSVVDGGTDLDHFTGTEYVSAELSDSKYNVPEPPPGGPVDDVWDLSSIGIYGGDGVDSAEPEPEPDAHLASLTGEDRRELEDLRPGTEGGSTSPSLPDLPRPRLAIAVLVLMLAVAVLAFLVINRSTNLDATGARSDLPVVVDRADGDSQNDVDAAAPDADSVNDADRSPAEELRDLERVAALHDRLDAIDRAKTALIGSVDRAEALIETELADEDPERLQSLEAEIADRREQIQTLDADADAIRDELDGADRPTEDELEALTAQVAEG